MAKKRFYIGDSNNIARKAKHVYIGNDNDVAKKVKAIYMGDANNIARKIFPAYDTSVTTVNSTAYGGSSRGSGYGTAKQGQRLTVEAGASTWVRFTIPEGAATMSATVYNTEWGYACNGGQYGDMWSIASISANAYNKNGTLLGAIGGITWSYAPRYVNASLTTTLDVSKYSEDEGNYIQITGGWRVGGVVTSGYTISDAVTVNLQTTSNVTYVE